MEENNQPIVNVENVEPVINTENNESTKTKSDSNIANMAIASMVTGILGMTLVLSDSMISLILSILGIVFGAIALKTDKHISNGFKNMAITGLVTGIIGILLTILVVFFMVVVFSITLF